MSGPLQGIRIIEFAGIGPAPFCGMMLADHGAEIIRIDRKGGQLTGPLARSKKSIVIDLKTEDGVGLARQLVESADGIIEGYRPGVMERLGLGPDVLCSDNEKLVYGRMTGWGQFGPYAKAAGHDINYIALSGALHTCGRQGELPTPPANYLGDFGGGGMMLAFGMVSALLGVKNGEPGQVIDCAMTDGSALLTGMTWGALEAGQWVDERGVNRLDTGAHFYNVYETKDGKCISIGSNEPQFYAMLGDISGLADDPDFAEQHEKSTWPLLKDKLAKVFKQKTRDEWCELLAATDICYAPVLSLREAPEHPHNAARETFIEVGGATQPAPAPRYSKTQMDQPTAAVEKGENSDEILNELCYSENQISKLKAAGIVS